MDRNFVKAKRKRGWTDGKRAAIILTPMILWWLVAAGFPMLFGFALGFMEWRGVMPDPKFAGLENFVSFFSSAKYLSILWRTVWLGVICTLATTLSGFGVALLMNMPLKGKGVYRSVWYLPAVTSTVAVSQILLIITAPFSQLSLLFGRLGWPAIDPMNDAGWGYAMIILYSIWKGVGGSALLWLAGLQCIDPVLYEAAEVDGAGTWQKFLHITLPGLKPIITYIVITGMIGALQIYEPVAFITNGGPVEATTVIALKILKDSFTSFNYGMAGASSLVLAVIIFAASSTYYILSRRSLKK